MHIFSTTSEFRSVCLKAATLLSLLDLSAAFDCVDHAIPVNKLKNVFGIDDIALK